MTQQNPRVPLGGGLMPPDLRAAIAEIIQQHYRDNNVRHNPGVTHRQTAPVIPQRPIAPNVQPNVRPRQAAPGSIPVLDAAASARMYTVGRGRDNLLNGATITTRPVYAFQVEHTQPAVSTAPPLRPVTRPPGLRQNEHTSSTSERLGSSLIPCPYAPEAHLCNTPLDLALHLEGCSVRIYHARLNLLSAHANSGGCVPPAEVSLLHDSSGRQSVRSDHPYHARMAEDPPPVVPAEPTGAQTRPHTQERSTSPAGQCFICPDCDPVAYQPARSRLREALGPAGGAPTHCNPPPKYPPPIPMPRDGFVDTPPPAAYVDVPEGQVSTDSVSS